MTKIKILFAILLMFLLGEKTYAQKNPLQIKAGFTLVPQGYIDLEKTNEAFNKTYTNIFGGVTTLKGNWFNTSFYSMTFNQVGTAFGYSFLLDSSSNLSLLVYTVGCKSIMINKDYVGLGVGVPLAGGRATGFIEVGSGTKKFKPGLYMGMFIPFTLKIK